MAETDLRETLNGKARIGNWDQIDSWLGGEGLNTGRLGGFPVKVNESYGLAVAVGFWAVRYLGWGFHEKKKPSGELGAEREKEKERTRKKEEEEEEEEEVLLYVYAQK